MEHQIKKRKTLSSSVAAAAPASHHITVEDFLRRMDEQWWALLKHVVESGEAYNTLCDALSIYENKPKLFW
jgi:hypothetical protein